MYSNFIHNFLNVCVIFSSLWMQYVSIQFGCQSSITAPINIFLCRRWFSSSWNREEPSNFCPLLSEFWLWAHFFYTIFVRSDYVLAFRFPPPFSFPIHIEEIAARICQCEVWLYGLSLMLILLSFFYFKSPRIRQLFRIRFAITKKEFSMSKGMFSRHMKI